MHLTNTACKNAKPTKKPYKLADGGGMYLEVMPSGGKYWRLKYRFANKEKKLAIGEGGLVPFSRTVKKCRAGARSAKADWCRFENSQNVDVDV